MTAENHIVEPEGSILAALDRISADVPEEGLSLADLFDALDERAFGALLFALALPCCIPFLYGIPQIVSLPMAAIAFQMVMGRHEPWLPSRFAGRMVDKKGLDRIARSGRKFFGWAEAIARPRLKFLSSSIAERFVGVILVFFCCSILVPLPATNTVPGFAVALVAFGLMSRDGIMMIIGTIIGTLWIAMLITVVSLAGLTFLTNIESTREIFAPIINLFTGGG